MFAKKVIQAVLSLLVISSAVLAQKESHIPAAKAGIDSIPKVKTGVKSYHDFITSKTITKKGFFTVHKIGEKYYFEIPDSLLDREILLTNWLIKVPGGSPKYGGEQANSQTFSFGKGTGDRLFLRVISSYNDKADSTNVIFKAVRNANIDPISMVFDIKAHGENNNSSIIDVTDMFQKDNMFSKVDGQIKGALGLGGFAADRSYLESMHAYPINIEITSVKTYSASPVTKDAAGRPAIPIEAAVDAGAITLEMRTTLMLMPKVPMQSRLFDRRVGYFAGGYSVYSDNQQKVEGKTFITRYRLEPKTEDIEKYKRGELVEPKKQIVYYTDPATPKQWRPYIIAAINGWQKAFEQAGFKNAIVGKEWPENDTTMSTEDARYAIIRYLPSSTENAYGPNIHDPRSGEILQSYVGWYHNIMTLLHDWYFTQASMVDPEARKMKFDDKLMGQLIQFAVAHEVGHTLGLRHNMGSSSLTPVEKLRDKAWVEANGHTVSIMDYARFNYVAQPEDHIGRAGIMPRIGMYDKWAIQWGYKLTGTTDEQADQKIVSKWIVDSLKANPKLWFGGEGRNGDPRCQTEDLSDNSVKASEYGIKNLKRIVEKLPEWTKEDNDLYVNLNACYRTVLGQFQRYALHVTNQVGGIYETLKTSDQGGDIYAPTPKAKQQEAVAFLNKEVFQTPTWLLDENILNKIGAPNHMAGVESVQNAMLNVLLTDKNLNSLQICSERFGAKNTYTLPEFLSDIKNGVFSELYTNKPIEIYRRNLQKHYVLKMFEALKEAETGEKALFAVFLGAEEQLPSTMNTDVPSIISSHLEKLRADALAAVPKTTDRMTKAHLQYLADMITKGLDMKDRNGKNVLSSK